MPGGSGKGSIPGLIECESRIGVWNDADATATGAGCGRTTDDVARKSCDGLAAIAFGAAGRNGNSRHGPGCSARSPLIATAAEHTTVKVRMSTQRRNICRILASTLWRVGFVREHRVEESCAEHIAFSDQRVIQVAEPATGQQHRSAADDDDVVVQSGPI